jgi:hypothetical protein
LLFAFELSRDSSFTPDSLVLKAAVSDTSIGLPPLLAERWYWWRVMSGSQGGSSDFSEVRRFRTGWPLPPEIVSPIAASNVETPMTYVWKSSNATQYQLRVTDDVTKQVIINTVTSDTTLTPAYAYAGFRIYTWTVTATNPYGVSDLSAEGRFRTKSGTFAELVDDLPAEYGLSHAYPNPFNPTTQMRFTLPEEAHVSLRVYNMLGQEIALLVDESLQAGSFVSRFDGRNLPSGTYVAVMTAGGRRFTQRMLLIK